MVRAIPIPWMRPFTSMSSRRLTTSAKMGQGALQSLVAAWAEAPQGDASIRSKPGEIDRLVLLGAAPNDPADKLKWAILYVVARDDASDDGPRLPKIREQYERSPQPKKLIVLNGSAHAQWLFQTDQGERVMQEILIFLSAN